MLFLIYGFFYFLVLIIFVFTLFFIDRVDFSINNFLIFSYLFLSLPFFDLIFDFFRKNILKIYYKNQLSFSDYKEKITDIFKIKKTYFILFIALFILSLFLNTYLTNYIFLIVLLYLFLDLKSINLFYITLFFFLILPLFYFSKSVYFTYSLNYFFVSFLAWISIFIFEKLKLSWEKILKYLNVFFKKTLWIIFKNLKQDYNVIFFDVLFLFFIFFILSFFYLELFELLVYLFSFVLFVYIVWKIFWLKIDYSISKQEIIENKSLFLFFILIWFSSFYWFYNKLLTQNTVVENTTNIQKIKPIIEELPLETVDIITQENQNNLELPEIETKITTFDISMFGENIWLWSEWENVKNLQLFLNEKWYYNFSIDWIYAESTQIAMRRFLNEKCWWNQDNQWILWPLARECIKKMLIE